MTGFYVPLFIIFCMWAVICLMVRRLPSPFEQKHRSKESDNNRTIAQISGELVLVYAIGIAIICLPPTLIKSWVELPYYGFVLSFLIAALFLIELVAFYAFSRYYENHEYLYNRENNLKSTN